MQNVKIETAQNVFIEYQPASLGDRMLAYLVDAIVLWSYLMACTAIFAGLKIEMGWAAYIVIYLPYLLYHLVSEIFMDGQSIGKKARNIKVVKLDGTQPSLGSYFIRWILRPIDILFMGVVAIIFIASGGKGQRLGDIAAGTSVVNIQRKVNLAETRLPQLQEDYEPVFPQVITLSDRDIAIIKEAIYAHTTSDNPDNRLLDTLSSKVKGMMQVESTMPNLAFLRTVLKDHAHLTSNTI